MFSVTFLDFDGNVMHTAEVTSDEPIDYSAIDTDSLRKNLDKFTQIQFASWDYAPEYVNQDTVIQALYEKGTISLVSGPLRDLYFINEGDINITGLEVTITVETQTPEFDADGVRIIETHVVNIEKSCYAVPATLDEAFAYGDTAEVSVYPLNSTLPILTYDIMYIPDLGNANLDSAIDSVDASFILKYYAEKSTGGAPDITEDAAKRADVDRSGSIDAIDSSMVLRYYAEASTGKNPSWDQILFGN